MNAPAAEPMMISRITVIRVRQERTRWPERITHRCGDPAGNASRVLVESASDGTPYVSTGSR